MRASFPNDRFLGIYKFDGEALVVAVATETGGARPTDFKPVPAVNALGKTPAERSAIIVVHAKKRQGQ